MSASTLPSLQWINGFVASVVRATSIPMTSRIEDTVNPLVFKVYLKFKEPISGKSLMLIWNLFQMYAVRNDSVAQGKRSERPLELMAQVIIKRRFGPERDENPSV